MGTVTQGGREAQGGDSDREGGREAQGGDIDTGREGGPGWGQ